MCILSTCHAGTCLMERIIIDPTDLKIIRDRVERQQRHFCYSFFFDIKLRGTYYLWIILKKRWNFGLKISKNEIDLKWIHSIFEQQKHHKKFFPTISLQMFFVHFHSGSLIDLFYIFYIFHLIFLVPFSSQFKSFMFDIVSQSFKSYLLYISL